MTRLPQRVALARSDLAALWRPVWRARTESKRRKGPKGSLHPLWEAASGGATRHPLPTTVVMPEAAMGEEVEGAKQQQHEAASSSSSTLDGEEDHPAAGDAASTQTGGSRSGALWPPRAALDASSFTYTRCYCEENVYLLLSRLADLLLPAEEPPSPGGRCLLAVVISNASKCIPIWHQRASVDPPNQPVLWDYHVIALMLPPAGQSVDGGGALVWDLDSELPFPCPAPAYVRRAFRPHMRIDSDYRQLFRVVPWPCYRDHFASDRSHMRTPDGQGWSAPPPTYAPLRGCQAESGMTLPRLWTMEEGAADDGRYGRVLTLQEFGRLCSGEGSATAGHG